MASFSVAVQCRAPTMPVRGTHKGCGSESRSLCTGVESNFIAHRPSRGAGSWYCCHQKQKYHAEIDNIWE